MDILLAILVAIPVLGFLIFVHELGHFLVAKKVGVHVERFSLGFGPKIYGKTVGETEYLLSLFPLGGYVKMLGEEAQESEASSEGSFSSQSIGKRLAIVLAGPFFNIGLAFLAFIAVFMIGIPLLTARIGAIEENSPAMAAGIQKGDLVLTIDHTGIKNWEDMRTLIQASPGKLLRFSVLREKEELHLIIEPRVYRGKNLFGEEIEVGQIGVVPAGDTIIKRYDPLSATLKGVEMTWTSSKITILGIVKMIEGKISWKNIMGPVGIVEATGKQVIRGGSVGLAHWVAILSLSLGIFNLLPIPILDGGHILFLSIEAVVGKTLSTKIRDQAVKIGFVLLVLLMLLALYSDVERIFFK